MDIVVVTVSVNLYCECVAYNSVQKSSHKYSEGKKLVNKSRGY